MSTEKNFLKITDNCYFIKNQNGLNNSLYEYFEATDNGSGICGSKENVREMVRSYPQKYPTMMIIIDYTFDHGVLKLQFFDIHKTLDMVQHFFD